ncbi:MAG TPA: LacI family DNA-binding transcriptional regulator [Acidimicrobiia bacterium]
MKPKLHEVAKIAEVSEATVSRVLNLRPGVAEETRRRVLDALSRLGYHVGSERARRSAVVGIITPELDNPIFPLFAQAIESKLARHGLLSVVGPATPTTAHERDYLEHFSRIGASGVVVIDGSYANRTIGYAAYESLLDDGLPVVLVNGIYFPCPVPAVTVDIAAAAQTAVRHLFSLGHRVIGCVTGQLDYSSSLDLASGYQSGLKREGLEFDERLLIETMFTVEGARSATVELTRRGVTGIVAGSDLMALGVVAAAESQGLRVPDGLSVVGFDGTPLLGMSNPALTTLRQPVDRMAQTVAMMLLGQFNGDRPKAQVFEAELIAGATTGAAPAMVH